MRSVDTRFWSDVWVRKLNALDRYVFLYFLTNEHSSWCGVYEVDLSMVAFETGVDARDLEHSILPRLTPKIIYIDGWVYIRNFERYHANRSEKTQKGIQAAWEGVPERIREQIKAIDSTGIPLAYPLDGVSPSASASASASATTLGANAPAQTFEVGEPEETPAQEATDFFSGIEDLAQGGEQIELTERLASLSQRLNVPKPTLWREVQAFTLYWTERSKNGKKQRWQLERTFEVDRRLLTWLRRASQGPPRSPLATQTRGKAIIGLTT